MTAPLVVKQAPPTGWAHTVAHVIAGVLGAVLAGLGAVNQIAGTVPRSTAIVVGALVSIFALLSWGAATYAVVAKDESRVQAWVRAHIGDFQQIAAEVSVLREMMPANLQGRFNDVENTAKQALAQANAISQVLQPPGPSLADVVQPPQVVTVPVPPPVPPV